MRNDPDAAEAIAHQEQAIGAMSRLFLKVGGYRVTAVGSLAEAVRRAREDAGIDLLVTDYHHKRLHAGLPRLLYRK